MGQFRAELVESQRQIDNVLSALSDMADPLQEDLRSANDRYGDAIARLRQHAGTLQREATKMRIARDAYFANWASKATEIDNPTIRASADTRRIRMRETHERIVGKSLAARDAYLPFIRDLQDVRRYLAPDLSRSSIADLTDAMPKIRASGTLVRDRIDDVIKELDGAAGM
jgi:hypothetical protein